jgi:NADH-quinone oxidoreductase subunit D
MSELLLPPEHRYAKRIKEQLNEDGSELSILNLGPTHQLHTVFSKYLVDGWRKNSGSGTNHWLHSELWRKLRKTVLLPNNTTYG